jgi:hypothetical protein
MSQSHFVATECNYQGGCSNIPFSFVAPKDIKHGMTIPVALSLLMCKGLVVHILTELHFQLQPEWVENIFDQDHLVSFQKDINGLLKAAGKTDTAIDPAHSIEQCLHMFAVETNLPKTPPPSPDPHDLGLLCGNAALINQQSRQKG